MTKFTDADLKRAREFVAGRTCDLYEQALRDMEEIAVAGGGWGSAIHEAAGMLRRWRSGVEHWRCPPCLTCGLIDEKHDPLLHGHERALKDGGK